MTEFRAVAAYNDMITDPCTQQDLQIMPRDMHEEAMLHRENWSQIRLQQLRFQRILEYAYEHPTLVTKEVLETCNKILGDLSMVQGNQTSPEVCELLLRQMGKSLSAIKKEIGLLDQAALIQQQSAAVQFPPPYKDGDDAVTWIASFKKVASHKPCMTTEALIVQFLNSMPRSFVQTVHSILGDNHQSSKRDLDEIYQMFADIFAPAHDTQMAAMKFEKCSMWPGTLQKATLNFRAYYTEFMKLKNLSKDSRSEVEAGEKFYDGLDIGLLGTDWLQRVRDIHPFRTATPTQLRDTVQQMINTRIAIGGLTTDFKGGSRLKTSWPDQAPVIDYSKTPKGIHERFVAELSSKKTFQNAKRKRPAKNFDIRAGRLPNAKCHLHPEGVHTNAQCYYQKNKQTKTHPSRSYEGGEKYKSKFKLQGDRGKKNWPRNQDSRNSTGAGPSGFGNGKNPNQESLNLLQIENKKEDVVPTSGNKLSTQTVSFTRNKRM